MSFDTEFTPDSALAKVIGSEKTSRPQAVKKMWAYLKEKGLQNPANWRIILADELLLPVFGGRKEITMFQLAGLINEHLS